MGPLSNTEIESYPHAGFSHPGMTSATAAATTGGPASAPGPPPRTALDRSPRKIKCFPMMNPQEQSLNITPEDNLACQSIEVFEATPDIIAEYTRSQTGSLKTVVPKQVGLRCLHCSRIPQSAPDSLSMGAYKMAFPASLASMADCVRLVADNHLVSCSVAPPEIQVACQRALTKRRQEYGTEGRNLAFSGDDNDRTRATLIDFCVEFCQQMGIANKPQHKSGIEFVAADSSAAMTPGGMSEREAPSYERVVPPSTYFDRMGYPTPYDFSRPGGFGEPIAPTPLQRRRDRPVDQAIAPSADEATPSSAGYPTPYSTQKPHHGSDYGGGNDEMATPAQPNFEGREGSGSYPTPQAGQKAIHGSPADYQQQYELPSNFPFYQESNRTWHCKFCAHVPPQFRDPQAIWSSPSGGPPPGNFIDQHLSSCRAYHQGYPSPPTMYPPPAGFGLPSYGGPYGPPPGLWEAHAGMHPQPIPFPHTHDPHYPYPHGPSHPDPSGVGRFHPGGQEDPGSMFAEHQRSRSVSVAAGSAPSIGARSAGLPTGSAAADAMAHSINYLIQFEKEYYERDPENATIPKLVMEEDRLLLTDYFFFLMKQLRLCRFSEADRKTRGGKREKVKIGYGGLQCIHCSDLPMSRKFFWSNVDRLANSFAEIPGHVLKCKRCPPQTKEALLQLKQGHPEQMAKLPRGSQKVFFRRMWRRLHDEDPPDDVATASPGGTAGKSTVPTKTNSPQAVENKSPEKDSLGSKKSSDVSPSSGGSDETTLVVQRTAKDAAKALAATANQSAPPTPLSPSSRILLAIPEDKEWLSEKDCFIRKQLEVFCATEDDVAAAQADRKYPVQVGQVGIRCIHCSIAHGSDAVGHGIAYPFTVSGIHESVREFHRLHLDSCENLPAAVKTKLATLGASSLSSVLRKYYILAAKALGLRDTKELGIRSGGESAPIGSQAAFSFAETDDFSSQIKEDTDEGVSFPAEDATDKNSESEIQSTLQVKEEAKLAESSDSKGVKRSPERALGCSDDSQPQQKAAKREISDESTA